MARAERSVTSGEDGATGAAAIVVHAGAWDVPEDEREAHRLGVQRAVHAGWAVLEGGGSAVDAVVAAVVVLEDDPAINAGLGSVLTREGTVEMDAALMDGRTLANAAVLCVKDVKNPILLARAFLGGEDAILVGEGASRLARERGLELVHPRDLVVVREQERLARWRLDPDRVGGTLPAAAPSNGPSDTVGAVARDAAGHLAAAASTGGRPGKRSGRVGDAPVVGSGFYADDRLGAAACTGWGERILRVGLARRAVDLLAALSPSEACRRALRDLEERAHGNGGLILLDRAGVPAHAFDTPAMPVAWRTSADR